MMYSYIYSTQLHERFSILQNDVKQTPCKTSISSPLQQTEKLLKTYYQWKQDVRRWNIGFLQNKTREKWYSSCIYTENHTEEKHENPNEEKKAIYREVYDTIFAEELNCKIMQNKQESRTNKDQQSFSSKK